MEPWTPPGEMLNYLFLTLIRNRLGVGLPQHLVLLGQPAISRCKVKGIASLSASSAPHLSEPKGLVAVTGALYKALSFVCRFTKDTYGSTITFDGLYIFSAKPAILS